MWDCLVLKCNTLHSALLSLIRQSRVQVPLDGIPPFCCVDFTTQRYLQTCCALNPTNQVIDKDVDEHRSLDRTQGDTTPDWPPPGCRAIDSNPLDMTIQPVFFFFFHQIVQPSNLHLSNLEIRMWWVTMSKTLCKSR